MINLKPSHVYTGLVGFLAGLLLGSVFTANRPGHALAMVIGLVILVGIGYTVFLAWPQRSKAR